MSNTFNFYGNVNINIDSDCNDTSECNVNINNIVLDFATGLIFNIEGSIGDASKLLFMINNQIVSSDCVENINSITMPLNKLENFAGNSGIITVQMLNNDCNEYFCNKTINYKTIYLQIPVSGNITNYYPSYISNCNNRTFVDLHSTNASYTLNSNGNVEILAQQTTEDSVIAYYTTCNNQVDNLILLALSNNTQNNMSQRFKFTVND